MKSGPRCKSFPCVNPPTTRCDHGEYCTNHALKHVFDCNGSVVITGKISAQNRYNLHRRKHLVSEFKAGGSCV